MRLLPIQFIIEIEIWPGIIIPWLSVDKLLELMKECGDQVVDKTLVLVLILEDQVKNLDEG
jgi:hypothetical protein